MTDMEMAGKIARAAAEQGGRVYFVGGVVRDRLLGQAIKDVDIEVHGLEPAKLEAILDSLGERMEMGASFGVYGLRHCGIDIALPRKEKATGRGHRDFAVFADPFLGTRKAAMRRDFTINALMEDVLTGEIVDHFGGQEDLARGVLRHVSDDTFAEDPLRVLRAAQFAARFGFSPAKETIALCRGMDLSTLAGERVFAELCKALLQAKRPSVFFEVLREMEQLGTWFGEIEALIGVMQQERFHPEGDVWNHTMLVLDEAAKLREGAQEPLGFMLSALCHDLGKPETTKRIDGVLRSFGHEAAGVPIAARLLGRMTREKRLSRYVQNMTALHMRPNALFYQKSGEKATNRLFDEALCPQDLLLLARADSLGRALEVDYGENGAFLQARLDTYRALMEGPYVRGADLEAAGFAPGKDFSGALSLAQKLRLSGVEREEALRLCSAMLRREREGAKGGQP